MNKRQFIKILKESPLTTLIAGVTGYAKSWLITKNEAIKAIKEKGVFERYDEDYYFLPLKGKYGVLIIKHGNYNPSSGEFWDTYHIYGKTTYEKGKEPEIGTIKIFELYDDVDYKGSVFEFIDKNAIPLNVKKD